MLLKMWIQELDDDSASSWVTHAERMCEDTKCSIRFHYKNNNQPPIGESKKKQDELINWCVRYASVCMALSVTVFNVVDEPYCQPESCVLLLSCACLFVFVSVYIWVMFVCLFVSVGVVVFVCEVFYMVFACSHSVVCCFRCNTCYIGDDTSLRLCVL